MRKEFLLCLVAVCCAACARSSRVVPSGKDTYFVARSVKGVETTGSRVKADALKEASEFCSKSGKTMEVIKATDKDMAPFRSDAQAEVEFRCN